MSDLSRNAPYVWLLPIESRLDLSDKDISAPAAVLICRHNVLALSLYLKPVCGTSKTAYWALCLIIAVYVCLTRD